mgnify:CR=1 FL=1
MGVSAITRQQQVTGVYLVLEPMPEVYSAEPVDMAKGEHEALLDYQSQFGANIGVDMFRLAHHSPWGRAA